MKLQFIIKECFNYLLSQMILFLTNCNYLKLLHITVQVLPTRQGTLHQRNEYSL